MKKINNLFNLFDVRHTKIVTLFCMMAVLLCCIQFTAPAITYSPDSVVTENEGGSISNGTGSKWAETGVSIVDGIKEGMVKVSMSAIPTLLIAAFLILGFCKDSRVAGATIKWIVTIFAVAVFICLINAGTAMAIITDFANQFSS